MSQFHWFISGHDGLPEDPTADKECDVCGGHGVVDVGGSFGFIPEECPKCIKVKEEGK